MKAQQLIIAVAAGLLIGYAMFNACTDPVPPRPSQPSPPPVPPPPPPDPPPCDLGELLQASKRGGSQAEQLFKECSGSDALMIVAGFYDPAHAVSGSPVIPDAHKAWKFYSHAAEHRENWDDLLVRLPRLREHADVKRDSELVREIRQLEAKIGSPQGDEP